MLVDEEKYLLEQVRPMKLSKGRKSCKGGKLNAEESQPSEPCLLSFSGSLMNRALRWQDWHHL